MDAKIIRIGNSKGIRFPKSLMDEVRLGPTADLRVKNGKIIISPKAAGSREGWAEAFAAADVSSTAEDEEWLNADLDSNADWTW